MTILNRQNLNYRRSPGVVTEEVQRVILVMEGKMKCIEIQEALGLRHEVHFRNAYLVPALEINCIAMTNPDKPTSSRQKYYLTEKGVKLKADLVKTKHL